MTAAPAIPFLPVADPMDDDPFGHGPEHDTYIDRNGVTVTVVGQACPARTGMLASRPLRIQTPDGRTLTLDTPKDLADDRLGLNVKELDHDTRLSIARWVMAHNKVSNGRAPVYGMHSPFGGDVLPSGSVELLGGGRFRAASSTGSGDTYEGDITPGRVGCSCPHFAYRIGPAWEQGMALDVDGCKHIKAARAESARKAAETARGLRLSALRRHARRTDLRPEQIAAIRGVLEDVAVRYAAFA